MDQSQEKGPHDNVLESPTWVFVVRIFQGLVAKIIFALCCVLIHDAYIDEEGLNLAVALITIIAFYYIVLSEKVASLRSFYNIIAVIVIDSLLVILWLASFAAMAAKRARYVVPVSVHGCYDDGDLIDSKTCYRRRAIDQMMKRDVILFKSGLAMTAAVAGLGALLWVLFIATLVFDIMGFLKGRKEGRFAMSSTPAATTGNENSYQMESKISESQPMSPQTYPVQTQTQPPVAPFQDSVPAQYPPQNQNPYQQNLSNYPSPTQSPAPNPYQGQQQQGYGQYPPQQMYQQPTVSEMSHNQPVSTVYASEMDGHQYPPQPVSPPNQHYPQPYPPPQH
ncbi:hypothetical protein BGZ63DRAFT_512809 [Mariannaea sp. PMI_226]|nr:hypothetical protein BGZ63DRAFT_512809 [Mariannaea sp. PMI_226]